MKKLLLTVILFAFLLTSFGCNNEYDYKNHVSQLRLAVYKGESDNFKGVVYGEEREEPFVADGFVGEIKKVIIVKVEFKNGSANDVKATVTYGNEVVDLSLSYNPVSEKSTASAVVENLPSLSSINLKITSGDIVEDVTLSSEVYNQTASYNQAIKSAVNEDKSLLEPLFEKGEKVEIHVRIISGENKNYYYVGFVLGNGKTYAYLIDGETSKLLAKKTIN